MLVLEIPLFFYMYNLLTNYIYGADTSIYTSCLYLDKL